MSSPQQKLVVVTGASRGLGLAISRALLGAGYRVLAVARHHSAELQQLAADHGEQLAFAACDLAEIEALPEACKGWVKQHGRPWGLINNAAVGRDGILATLHDRDIELLLRVNLQAPILLCKYLSRPMLLNGGGRIVNIASVVANTGYKGLSVYAASKAGLVGLSRSLARELGKGGITVNALLPGFMATDMTAALEGDKLDSIQRRSAIGRLAGVDEVAAAVVYLLSDAAAAVTGTTLTVDGGGSA